MLTCCTSCESVINLTYSEQLQFSHTCDIVENFVDYYPVMILIKATNTYKNCMHTFEP